MPSHLDQTSLVNKGFIIWEKNTLFLLDIAGGLMQVAPSGQDGTILPAWVANHSTGFDSFHLGYHGAVFNSCQNINTVVC